MRSAPDARCDAIAMGCSKDEGPTTVVHAAAHTLLYGRLAFDAHVRIPSGGRFPGGARRERSALVRSDVKARRRADSTLRQGRGPQGRGPQDRVGMIFSLQLTLETNYLEYFIHTGIAGE